MSNGDRTIKILDQGYISLIETWGSDERIIESARMSTANGFNGWGAAICIDCGQPWETTGAIRHPNTPRCPSGRGGGHTLSGEQGDEKLLRFLYENQHATPFEMAGAVVEVKAPILVFREWHRHRTQSYNEMSARYVALPNENYAPSLERVTTGGQSRTNKQGSGEAISDANALEWMAELADVYDHAQRVYESAIKRGIAKELARLPIPVARYSRMRASANLRNWLGFLTLRQSPKAQWEIRQFADGLHTLLCENFPRTIALFDEMKKSQ